MTLQFQNDMEQLKKRLLGLSALVEESVYSAIKAIKNRDEDLARRVIQSEQEIDQVEIEIEGEAFKILAQNRLIAADLRLVITIIKINNELEQIGDLASDIAQHAIDLCLRPPINPPDLSEMAEKVQRILKESLDALMAVNPELTQPIFSLEEDIDEMEQQIKHWVTTEIPQNLINLESILDLQAVSSYLERIADHAKKIAENVIYEVEGKIVRHQDFMPDEK